MTAVQLGDREHRILDRSHADVAVNRSLVTFVTFEVELVNICQTIITMNVVPLEPNSAGITFIAVVKRLLVLVDEEHELAEFARN